MIPDEFELIEFGMIGIDSESSFVLKRIGLNSTVLNRIGID